MRGPEGFASLRREDLAERLVDQILVLEVAVKLRLVRVEEPRPADLGQSDYVLVVGPASSLATKGSRCAVYGSIIGFDDRGRPSQFCYQPAVPPNGVHIEFSSHLGASNHDLGLA